MAREWKLFHIHLQDEIPGIGQGQRRVEAQVGTKWVFVRRYYGTDHVNHSKARRKHKVRLALWQSINPTPITLGDHHVEP
jgi:hypothetical protein